MKARVTISAILATVALFLQGCSNAPRYEAESVHRTMSVPGFSSKLDAVGITKETMEDGTVIRRAESLTHTTSVLGFSRTAVYKGAELETVED